MRTEQENSIIYNPNDLLELLRDRLFYTTGEKPIDIECDKGDIFVVLFKEKNDQWTLYHQKSMTTMPDFTDDFLDEIFIRID